MYSLLANAFFETRVHPTTGEEQHLLRAMPVMLGVLCVLAVAYRYYSAFLAAKVAALDDTPRHARPTSSTTARTTTRPTAGCCSATTSPPSPGPAR